MFTLIIGPIVASADRARHEQCNEIPAELIVDFGLTPGAYSRSDRHEPGTTTEDAMPLPVGTWVMNANGTVGSLLVGSTSTGTINGNANGQPISGFFDETEQEFSFMRVTSADVSTFEVYHGTLFEFSPNAGTQVHTLAGTFRAYPSAGASSPLPWSAQLSVKLKEKEGKDGKDKEASKDSKDIKDRKDNKEFAKEKDPGKEVSKEKEVFKELDSPPLTTPSDLAVEQLAMRVNALEQQVAVGRTFIAPEERPAVGTRSDDKKPPR